MEDSNQYGNHRCIEPKHSFPDSAWKLDNTMSVFENEILIDVSLLNIDSNSFKQIYVECQGESDRISKKVLDLVTTRGKLHNPLTGTGGIFYGRVKEIGKKYPNEQGLIIGDEIISLTSLALTPLKIDKILNIDSNSGQIEILGNAILFSNSPLCRVPNNLPLKLLLSVLDEAGAAIQSYKLAEGKKNVLIIGATGELGLMCAYAARKKIGTSARIIGIRSNKGDEKLKEELTDVFDEVYCLDVLKPIDAYDTIKKCEHEFDLTINCINTSGTEMLSILSTSEGGTIYLASLSSNYKTMCLSVEGIAKDLNIIGYKGYTKGHASFTINLLEENPKLVDLLKCRLERNYTKDSLGNNLSLKSDIELNILKDINLEEYVFVSREMQKVLDNAFKVANFDCTVLITGESGVGKEIIAKVIHKSSDRNYLPSIKINCGSISKNLLESELFGYEKGAFTGADKNGKMGFFEIASGGTLFLDEIGELPLDLQVKLLRAIQEKEIYRVGGVKPIVVDVRIIAATNKNLRQLVEEGRFRQDLYYRLNVFPIEIPPLRLRTSDIIPLTNNFTNRYNEKFKLNKKFTQGALEYLLDYSWPGNIRELENLIQRLLIGVNNDLISILDVAKSLQSDNPVAPYSPYKLDDRSLEEILDEKEYEILKLTKEKYITTRKIAEALNLSQSTLVRKLKKYNL